MLLSAEQYETMIDSIVPQAVRRPGEKRRGARVVVRGEVTIIPLHEGRELHPLSVGVTDVSRQGIGLSHNHSMDVGLQFILCLSFWGAERTRAIICTIRNVEKADEEHFRFGCEFTDDFRPTMASDEILTGLAEFQAMAEDSPLGKDRDSNDN